MRGSKSAPAVLLLLLLAPTLGAEKWYKVDYGWGLNPRNFQELGDNRFCMTVKPGQETVRISSVHPYSEGKLEFKVKSASVMPGIITAVYFASGNGRRGDLSTGSQDEIDLEWKGNDPTRVQTNVFLNGQEDLKLIDLQGNSSTSSQTYALQWNAASVQFSVGGHVVRSKDLPRPLQPMELHMAVWTTRGGWPGLIKWGGETKWEIRAYTPATAEFEIVSLPSASPSKL